MMTYENQAKLVEAYKFAICAEQDGIADLLEDLILSEMEQSVTLPHLTPKVAEPDNMPPIPAYGNRNVVTCATGKEDTK